MLKGLRISPPDPSLPLYGQVDPAVELVQSCPLLEQLEISNTVSILPEQQGNIDPDDLESPFPDVPSLNLTKLEYLCIHILYPSALLASLLKSSLPSLRHLMITPYDDGPSPALFDFLTVHGTKLSTLHISMPKHWPIAVQPRTLNILQLCPYLKHLSIDYPLPSLILPTGMKHSLRALTVPRPNSRFFNELEKLLPRLPSLTIVRTRNVKWLKSGVSAKALEAGVQGEMRDWRKRLARRGVRLVDQEWKDPV